MSDHLTGSFPISKLSILVYLPLQGRIKRIQYSEDRLATVRLHPHVPSMASPSHLLEPASSLLPEWLAGQGPPALLPAESPLVIRRSGQKL